MTKLNKQPLVSIVTPVYNNAEFFAEAIESVLAQTYENWEYLIVNNCSTDGSGEIAQCYAAKDPRVRVIHNTEFLRAMPNHNHALRLISPDAKYVKMVFADDWIFPECVERMVAAAEANPSVGLVGALSLQGPEVMWSGLPYPSERIGGKVAGRKLLTRELYGFGPPNASLYRADLVRKREKFFNEGNIHADTEIALILMKESDYSFIHQVLTFSRVREKSLTAMSVDFQTYYAGTLQLYDEHATPFLEPDELRKVRNFHLREYYRFLGRCLLEGRTKEFWQYHKRKLGESRAGYSKLRVIGGAASTILDAALNPKRSLEKLLGFGRRIETITGNKATSQGEQGA